MRGDNFVMKLAINSAREHSPFRSCLLCCGPKYTDLPGAHEIESLPQRGNTGKPGVSADRNAVQRNPGTTTQPTHQALKERYRLRPELISPNPPNVTAAFASVPLNVKQHRPDDSIAASTPYKTGIGIPDPVDFRGGSFSHTPAIAAPQSGHAPGSRMRFSST